MEKLTYVLIISETFPSYHPKAGQATEFKAKIACGLKLHTIRQNYPLWKHRAEKINKGEAILSVRKWTGTPYRSKQEELFQFKKIGVQAVKELYGNGIRKEILAKNDGLTYNDFWNWFNGCPDNLSVIIHFTDFRY